MWGVCFVLISSSCILVFGALGRLYFMIVAFPAVGTFTSSLKVLL